MRLRFPPCVAGAWATTLLLASCAHSQQTPAQPMMQKVLVKQGAHGVNTYRIPGLAVSKKGTLLAVFDLRHQNSGDLPADIDVGLMRSTDNGDSWSAPVAIMDYDKNEPNSRGNGVGDPSILVDKKTGRIWVAALWSKGNRGYNGSGPGLSPEETGQFVINYSDDDGLTWSAPVSITPQIKDPKWRLLFNGPGAGIQTKEGALVFPAQYRDETGLVHSCFIFSADAGKNWHISPPATVAPMQTNEAQIAQLSDGALLLTMRDAGGGGQRIWARWEWKNGLASGAWGAPWRDLPDPTCQASLIRHPFGTLFFSNPATSNARKNFTVRASFDDGLSWNTGRLLDARPSAYSCLAVLKDGSLGVLYETGDQNPYQTLTFARFAPEWITSAP